MHTPDTSERRGDIRATAPPARWRRCDRNGRSKPAVDLRHQTLAVWPETRRGSAETGRCAAAALAEWGSTTGQRQLVRSRRGPLSHASQNRQGTATGQTRTENSAIQNERERMFPTGSPVMETIRRRGWKEAARSAAPFSAAGARPFTARIRRRHDPPPGSLRPSVLNSEQDG